jgi:hypothetical protein
VVWLAGFGLDERQRGGMHAPRNALRGLNIDISIGGPPATTTRSPARAPQKRVVAQTFWRHSLKSAECSPAPDSSAQDRRCRRWRATWSPQGPRSGTERVAQLNDDARAVTLEQAAKADVVILAAAVPAGN